MQNLLNWITCSEYNTKDLIFKYKTIRALDPEFTLFLYNALKTKNVKKRFHACTVFLEINSRGLKGAYFFTYHSWLPEAGNFPFADQIVKIRMVIRFVTKNIYVCIEFV